MGLLSSGVLWGDRQEMEVRLLTSGPQQASLFRVWGAETRAGVEVGGSNFASPLPICE